MATEKNGTVTARLELNKEPAVVSAALSPHFQRETVQHASKDPAVFAAGEPIAFRVVLKYTGDKPKVGFVLSTSCWTFLFKPLDGGVPREAVLQIRQDNEPVSPGGGPEPPLMPMPLENGKEGSRLFVLFQPGGAWWHEYADAEDSRGAKEKTVDATAAGKIQLDGHPCPACPGTYPIY